MRNVVTFDVRGVCDCVCVMNVLDGSDCVNLIFEIGEYENPQIEIIAADNTTTTALTVENGVATFTLNLSLFDKNMTVKTRFLDVDKIGKQFIWEIYRYNGIEGGTIPDGYTLRVTRRNENTFELDLYSVNETPATGYDPDGFDVTDTGELMLKTPHEIRVSVDDNDLVTNLDFIYDNDYHKSFSVEYDPTTKKITKFGRIPIVWE